MRMVNAMEGEDDKENLFKKPEPIDLGKPVILGTITQAEELMEYIYDEISRLEVECIQPKVLVLSEEHYKLLVCIIRDEYGQSIVNHETWEKFVQSTLGIEYIIHGKHVEGVGIF